MTDTLAWIIFIAFWLVILGWIGVSVVRDWLKKKRDIDKMLDALMKHQERSGGLVFPAIEKLFEDSRKNGRSTVVRLKGRKR